MLKITDPQISRIRKDSEVCSACNQDINEL